jgi:hypothetical protein
MGLFNENASGAGAPEAFGLCDGTDPVVLWSVASAGRLYRRSRDRRLALGRPSDGRGVNGRSRDGRSVGWRSEVRLLSRWRGVTGGLPTGILGFHRPLHAGRGVLVRNLARSIEASD